MIRKVVGIVLGNALLVVFAAFLWGLSLPRTTTAERTAELRAPVGEVFRLVTDVQGQARWRSDVGRVEPLPGGGWREHASDGSALTFRTLSKEPDRLFDIAYTSTRGFEGGWTGTFEATPQGTRVRFVETVTVPDALDRVLARLFAPPGSHLDRYLADLRRTLEDMSGNPPTTR